MRDQSLPSSAAPTVHEELGSSQEEKEGIQAEERVVYKETILGSAPSTPYAEDFPEGGMRAWLVVLGAAFNVFSTFGFVNSFGVFQSYYSSTLLHSSSPSQIAWIGSIQYALVFFPSLIVGRLFDIGAFKSVQVSSTIVLVVATFLVAECTQYWQFLLCQGIAIGLGCGGVFGANSPVVAHWFKKKLGFAMGIVAVGSSMGGTTIPIMARRLIEEVGFKWTMRIIGFILLLTLGISCLATKRRLPPSHDVSGGLLNLRAFKDTRYLFFCISGFITFLGIYTVLTFIDIAAVDHGVDPQFSFYLVAIANGGSTLGRFLGGWAADWIGPLNVMIPATVLAAILTFAWPFASSKGTSIAIAIIYGFGVGSYVTLLTNPIVEMGNVEDVGRRIGMFLTLTACGALIGPPISGAINNATASYEAVGYYAGAMSLVGAALMITCRYHAIGWTWTKF